jgi:rubrerythrin
MNFLNILNSLDKIDGEAYERIEHASRRHFMNRISSKVAAAAAPVLLASVVNKAFAYTDAAVDVLKYALTLEYLEDEFYKMGNAAAATLIPDPYKTVFAQIGKHETQHVAFLETALGAKKGPKPMFDFTQSGALAPFTNFDTFVYLSHAFEDTGVRAYKGQADRLMDMTDKTYLKVALQIHSVEARHASISRRILGKIRNNPTIKGWITNDEGSPAAVYTGMFSEATAVQAGINLIDFAGIDGLNASNTFKAATEAFDEILTMEEVYAIATPFIKP